MENNNFKDFTNLYELSKTLRFELRPRGKTKIQLENDWIIKKDKQIKKDYHEIKKFLDLLHIEFVEKSLENIYLGNLEEYFETYKYLKLNPKDRNLKNKFEKIEIALRKELVSFFILEVNSWVNKYSFLKKWWIWFLTEKEVLDLLEIKFPDNKNLFERFKWFFTYFQNFNESRKNFYSDDGRAWAIATRAIDENLIIFIENIKKYEEFNIKNPNFFTDKEKEIFKIEFYNFCVNQKWIDKYNEIIWARNLEEWKNTEWINQRINLKKQNDLRNSSKNKNYPKFDLLYKQILSKKDKDDFIESIESDSELFNEIEKSKERNYQKIKEAINIFEEFFKNIDNNNIYDLKEIFLSKISINTLSSKYFEKWNSLAWFLEENWNKKLFSLLDVKNALDSQGKGIFSKIYKNIISENKTNFENFINIYNYEFHKKLEEIEENLSKINKINEKNFTRKEKEIQIIKNYFDSVLDFYKMTKYFKVELKKYDDKIDKDISFYTKFDEYIDNFKIWKDYNLVRNFLTKKNIKTDKIKLNFDNSQFLKGWDRDKEKERLGIILRKNWKYFLVILKKWNNKIFENYKYEWWDFYEKMEYKQLNNVYRQIPRLCFPLQKKINSLKSEEKNKYIEKYIENFWYNEEIAKIKEEFDNFQKNKEKWDRFDIEKIKKLIEYYKNAILKKYGKTYNLSKIEKNNYDNLSEFYDEVEKAMYSLKFVNIWADFIDNLEENGDIYLFQIYNKDFSETKEENSKENIHTKYFKYLFNENNLNNLKIKLSGWAEVFFRDKTENLEQAKDKNWENMFYKLNWENLKVLKHRRYVKDHFQVNISITLNTNSWDMFGFNQFFNNNFDVKHVIWIDRWEKNLAYFSVIDLNWKIKDIWSLNIVNKINYLTRLEEKETKRANERLNWWEIENIKNLKDWYISALVNEICKLIIKYKAIVVFEDLNSKFKIGRQKIEKQVYQKLELALAKKLNFLNFKDKKDTEVWWIWNSIQLTPKVRDYQDIANYKQSWIILYTNPAFTSTTCPECWWRKTINFPKKINKEVLIKFLENIEILYNPENFIFKYKNWIWNVEEISSIWERTYWNNKEIKTERINLNDELKKLFLENKINIEENISKQINSKDITLKCLEKLLWIFKLVNSIRNTDSASNKDIIHCPSCWFNSENWFQWFSYNWDANWAYNIARKWIIMLENIKVNSERPNLFVSNSDWDTYLWRKKISLLDIIYE